jgi:NAD-dependent deacetylase
MKKKLVVFSGAGMSAESGLATFRDSNGLWEQYQIEEVATPEAWQKDPEKVLHFYNVRRKQLLQAQPNAAHKLLAQLQANFDLKIITQNIDDLHERAGAKQVLHLHGELRKARSCGPTGKVYPIEGASLNWGEHCQDGHQLRPHVVWFGEEVPAMEEAIQHVQMADLFLVMGTSLSVYPAASLVFALKSNTPAWIIDPDPSLAVPHNFNHIAMKATVGLKHWLEKVMN